MNRATQIWRQIQRHTGARIGKNALALLAAQGGGMLFSVLLASQLMRTVKAAGLGRYLSVLTLETIVLSVADLGLNTLTVRDLSQKRSVEETASFWGTVVTLKLLTALTGMLVLNGLIAPLLFGDQQGLLLIASLALLPDAFNGAATALFKAKQRMEISSAITLAIRFLSTAGGILFLWLGYDERTPLFAYVGSSILGAIAFGLILRRWGINPHWRAVRSEWRAILREALPISITGIAGILYTRIDLLMLFYWQGDVAAGIYGAAYRLWQALGILPVSLLDALFPELSQRSDSLQDRIHLQQLYRQGRRAMIWVTALLVILSLFAAPYLVHLLYGNTEDVALITTLFRLLLPGVPLAYLSLLNGYALYAIGQQRRVTVAMVVITTLNGLLNLLVIPRWSYWGAAVVTLLTEMGLFVLLQGTASRLVLLPKNPPGEPHQEGL
jgi:O-antigen/teichoic acid export membrane protein